MDKRQTNLLVAEMEDGTYKYKFDFQPPLPLKANDIVLGIIQELMDWDAYTSFDKQTEDTKQDILEILVSQKKKDGKYTKIAMDEPLFDEDL